ncbi:hypothetical protein LSCM1_02338 [Leishmania martiniquensis]|uniref:Uncharacterized protein n=1 Tax=Leishmania martiniquensis TaxID=1580590 RepID=A0A836H1P5_9TRYP|nr:hypothetical protein LSCM1_02338 [Leishmania martiniquensis]
MSGIITVLVKRCASLRASRARAVWITAVCILVAITIRILYRYAHLSPKDTKRVRGRSSRTSKDTRGHSSRGRDQSGSSSKRRNVDPSLPTVLMLVGIHGSGKSFWAKRYTEMVHKSFVIVSSDAIRSQLTGTINNYTREDEVQEQLLKEVGKALELRRSCIVDDCVHTLSPEFRAKLKELAPDGKANRVVKVFSVKPSYAMMRIQSDVEEGAMVRCIPTITELEKEAEHVEDFQKTYREDGWVEN